MFCAIGRLTDISSDKVYSVSAETDSNNFGKTCFCCNTSSSLLILSNSSGKLHSIVRIGSCSGILAVVQVSIS